MVNQYPDSNFSLLFVPDKKESKRKYDQAHADPSAAKQNKTQNDCEQSTKNA
jgi:hypothetical protein